MTPTTSGRPEADVRGAVRPRALAFYLPQFHPIAENDAWWGRGFTEWRNVAAARPLFDGHEQPHLPADLGFYDLRLPEARQAQADLARAHGIDGFVYYHYWSEGRRLLERPFDEVLSSGQPGFPFALCWANEDWRARWDGASGQLLWEQRYSDTDDAAHIDYLVRCFSDPRYIRVDGKPLFLVYRAASLPEPAVFAAGLRAAATAAGLGEILLCRVESGFPGEVGDPAELGFDAAIEFQPDWERLPVPDAAHAPHTVMDYAEAVEAMLAKPTPAYRRLPCVTPRWDNTARRPDGATVLRGSTPELYRRWLSRTADVARQTAADPVIFVNSWNEWAEGAHLEPDQRHGHAYLLAHAGGIGGSSPLAEVARPAMAEHHATFSDLVEKAERAAISGEDEQALELAWAAGEWAWHHHTGRFASERLEGLLRAVARRRVHPQRVMTHQGPRRILHVLTETEALGGHLDTICQWLSLDQESVHTVVLTGQGTAVPASLQEAARNSGASLDVLEHPSLLQRVEAVATAASQVDLVVLHVHPCDAVAATALAHPERGVPTVLVNHADQVFWLGLGAADVVAESRPSAATLSAERRGVPAEWQVRLPVPVPPAQAGAGMALRQALGIPLTATVIATSGSPYRDATPEGPAFADLLTEVLAARPDVFVVATGVSPSEPGWEAVDSRFGDHLRAVEATDDLAGLLAVADLYVDSYPLADSRPVLQAGAAALPVVLFAPRDLEKTPLGWDGLGADDELVVRVRTADAWRTAMAALLDDPALRRRQGGALATAVASSHGAEAFLNGLRALYERAWTMGPRPYRLPEHIDAVPSPWQDLLTTVHLRSGMARDVQDIIPAVTGSHDRRSAAYSVLIRARRGADALLRCLAGVLEGCGDQGALDVIVLHDGQPEVAGVLHALRDDVRGLLVTDRGTSATAWRAGLELAHGRRVLLLSDDVVCQPGLLAHCERVHLREGPRSAVLVEMSRVHDRSGGNGDAVTDVFSSAEAGLCVFADRQALLAGGVEMVRHPIATAVPPPSQSQVLCIAGMHRSHTSVCAQWLQACGLQIDNGWLVPGADGNEGGHFEDLDFHALHSTALRRRYPHSDGWKVTGPNSLRLEGDELLEAQQLVRVRNARYRVWGWKEPRTVAFLDDWRTIIPDMKVLALWRREDEVVRSLVRRSLSSNLEMAIDQDTARSLWRGHNEVIHRYRSEHADTTVLVQSASLFVDDRPIFDAVNALLDGSLTYVPFRAFADPSRRPHSGMQGPASPLEQALRELSVEVTGRTSAAPEAWASGDLATVARAGLCRSMGA